MQTEPEDRFSHGEATRGPSIRLILALMAIAAVIGVLYFPGGNEDPPAPEEPAPEIVRVQPPTLVAETPPAPDIPTWTEPVPQALPQKEQEPPPTAPAVTLETGDQELRDILAEAGESVLISQVLQHDELVHRGVGVIDGLSRGLIPRKALPLAPLKEKFSTVTAEGQTYIDPASYSRYDNYTQAIASLNVDLIVSTFHRFRPLLEQAYAGMGYSATDMDNALIRSLDYMLATPQVEGPVAVKRKEAVYLYVDPELEQLSPLQKQILRMGPENATSIKRQVVLLRKGLLDVSP